MLAITGADTLYYQYNNHGDVVRVLDQLGTLKNEYDYDAFGNAITEKETVKNPYRYAGYYQDTESGLKTAAKYAAKKVGSEITDTLSEKLGKEADSEVAEEAGSKTLAKTLNNSSSAGMGVIPNKQIAPNPTSMPKTDFFAGPEGIAKSLDEYDALTKGGTSANKKCGSEW